MSPDRAEARLVQLGADLQGLLQGHPDQGQGPWSIAANWSGGRSSCISNQSGQQCHQLSNAQFEKCKLFTLLDNGQEAQISPNGSICGSQCSMLSTLSMMLQVAAAAAA